MKAIVFDGNSILNRAFYGVRPLATADKLPTNACYGFTTIIRRALADEKPDFALIAFDMRAKTFRHKMYDGYKATRKGMPEELALQFPWAKKLAAAMGLAIAEREGFEADDIIGSFSRICREADTECIIVTGDRDSYQLVGGGVTVHLAATSETKIITTEYIHALYGLTPTQLIDVKAIMGDSSDNIPGVPGIGEKGAVALISSYGSLDGVYEHIGEVKGALATKLAAGKESAYMSLALARIELHVPISEMLDEYRYRGEQTAELRELFTRLEFRKLLDTLTEAAPEVKPFTRGEHIAQSAADIISTAAGNTLYILPENGLLLTFDGENRFCCELSDECRKLFDGCLSLCTWSVKELLHALAPIGITPTCRIDDLSLLGYVVSPADSGIVFGKIALACAGVSAETPSPELFPTIYTSLTSKLNDEMKSLYETIELPLAYTLFRMERAGFMLDRAGLSDYSLALEREAAEAEQLIYDFAGHEFNINSPKQLGTVLFDELELRHGKKTKNGYSTGADILESIAYEHPIVDQILTYRRLAKLKSTYCDGLLKVIDTDGRVHTTFKQTMTMTGRLSSVEPNLQNIPVRTAQGRELRRFFAASEGCLLVDADYSQIELRVLAHLSGDETLISAFRNGDDIHTLTASQVFGVPMSEVTPRMRSRAKAVNFGIIYGIGDFSLSRDIGVTRREAAEYIESYFMRYPKVREYLHTLVSDATRNGYTDTMFGRRRYIPELAVSNKNLRAFGERVAMNTPVQGTAADIIKLAMIRAETALAAAGLSARLILQIHDELIVESPENEAQTAAAILTESMQSAAKLDVPLIADSGIGKNWYDAK